jgi:ribosomal protein S27E
MNFKSKTEPQLYEVQGKTVRCYHCQNSFFWVDQSATSLICSECGYIHWFLAK